METLQWKRSALDPNANMYVSLFVCAMGGGASGTQRDEWIRFQSAALAAVELDVCVCVYALDSGESERNAINNGRKCVCVYSGRVRENAFYSTKSH